MRTLLIVVLLVASAALKAQTSLPLTFSDYAQRSLLNSNHIKDSTQNKKWFVTKYSGISAGFSFFKGGNATVITAPVGVQLNRKLTNNFYAFAGVSVAPAYINFNRSFLSGNMGKPFQNSGFLNTKQPRYVFTC